MDGIHNMWEGDKQQLSQTRLEREGFALLMGRAESMDETDVYREPDFVRAAEDKFSVLFPLKWESLFTHAGPRD